MRTEDAWRQRASKLARVNHPYANAKTDGKKENGAAQESAYQWVHRKAGSVAMIKDFLEDHGIVVLFVFGRVDQREMVLVCE